MTDPAQVAKLFAHIDAHHAKYVELLKSWSSINSGTFNLPGLERMLAALREAFAPLGATDALVDLPPAASIGSSGEVAYNQLGRGLSLIKRGDAPRRVFLNIHYDTVFGAESAFQTVKQLDADTINGPGVCDAKGGIVTMLAALRAFEETAPAELKKGMGWEVYLNPDEEIGSPGSVGFLREAANRAKTALLFEPALPDGALVGARKGSGNFTAVVRGRAAHAGRDFQSGRSATVALATLIGRLNALNKSSAGDVIVNCGRIEGGGAVNVVPALAIGRFNARVTEAAQMQTVSNAIHAAAEELSRRDGINVTIHGGFASPPKLVDEASQRLIEMVQRCADEVGLGNLSVRASGGASDGNKLSAAGMAVIDTLGPVGGDIHSDREFVKLSSIADRAKMTALLLARLARNDE